MTTTEPQPLTVEQVAAEPWKYDSRQWRSAHGIHIPWIAELSPFQVGLMGKQQRTRYDRGRAQVWKASAEGCHAWAVAVRAAFDAGKFEQYAPGVSDEANTAIFGLLRAREEAATKARYERLHALNQDMTGLKPGDIVYCIMSGSYGPVVKLSAKSVRVKNTAPGYGHGEEWKHSITAIQWLNHNDLVALVKAGAEAITRKTQ